jgi:hypothetical protein
MQQRYPPQQPPRPRGRHPSSGAGGTGHDPSRLMPRPWPGGPNGPLGDPLAASRGYGSPSAYPPPGAPPASQPRPVRRRTFGRMPAARVPATPMARTDPTLYEWDRLTPDQQQEVLATIKAANLPRHGARLLNRGVLLTLLAAALALLVWLLLLR